MESYNFCFRNGGSATVPVTPAEHSRRAAQGSRECVEQPAPIFALKPLSLKSPGTKPKKPSIQKWISTFFIYTQVRVQQNFSPKR